MHENLTQVQTHFIVQDSFTFTCICYHHLLHCQCNIVLRASATTVSMSTFYALAKEHVRMQWHVDFTATDVSVKETCRHALACVGWLYLVCSGIEWSAVPHEPTVLAPSGARQGLSSVILYENTACSLATMHPI